MPRAKRFTRLGATRSCRASSRAGRKNTGGGWNWSNATARSRRVPAVGLSWRSPRRQRNRSSRKSPRAGSPRTSITNVQYAGVDEGGIVKLHGDHLVILRRGRLFTVNVGDDQLKPVSAIEAVGSGIDPPAASYDEMLIWGNTVAVIGYSHVRGGTEVGLFEISREGWLRYKATYILRSMITIRRAITRAG